MKTKLVYLFSVLLIGGVALAAASDFTVKGILTVANTGLHLLDTNATHDLIVKPGSDLSSDRILTVTTGDAARTLTMSGDATLPDPRVGTVTNTKWCVGDGSGYIQCTANAPALTPWTGTIDADDNDLGDGGVFEVDGLLCTTDNTLDMALAAGKVEVEVDDDDATGATFALLHDSASPQDGDVIGTIAFEGNDDTTAWMSYAQITAEIQDPALGPPASEEGIMRFSVVQGAGVMTEYMRLDGSDAVQGIVASKSVGLGGNDLQDLDDINGTPPATDVATRVTVITTQPVVVTPGAANVAGANLVLQPSPGARTLTGVTRASVSEGATVTVSAQAQGVALAACVKTEGNGTAGTFECNGAGSDVDCVANLYATYVATPCTGVTVTYTAASETLTWSITPGAASYLTVAVSDTDIAATQSQDGQVLFPTSPGASLVPGLAAAGYATSGVTVNPLYAASYLCYAGTCGVKQTASSLQFPGGFLVADGGMVGFGTSGANAISFEQSSARDQFSVVLSDGAGNQLNIVGPASTAKDCAQPDATDPTLSVYSDTDCSMGTTLYIRQRHNKTDGILETGAGDILFQPAGGDVSIGAADVVLGTLREWYVGGVASVDMSSVARQVLYTVPTGKTFYPRKVCVGPCTAVIDTAVGGFGRDTPAADFYAATIQTHTAAASEACWFPAVGVAVPSIAAAGTFAYDGTVAEVAADTCTMSVYGELR